MLTLISCTFLLACGPQSKTTPSSLSILQEIPTLLDRPAAIQYGKEWETVQNAYGSARKTILDNPKDLDARLKLVEVFVNEARITGEHGHYYPAALTLIDQVLEKASQQSDARFRALSMQASVQLSQHEFQKALVAGKVAVQLNSYNAQVYGGLVDAYVELGNYEAAVQMADKMVSIRPDLRSYSRISYLREIHGDLDGAIEAMELAVAAGYPGYEQTAWARLTLGQLYDTNGELEKATQQYQKVLEERPDYPFALAALAEIAVQQKAYDKAENLLQKACAIIPEVGFYEQLAHLYKKTNRSAAADALIPEILAMLEDDVNSGHQMNMEYANIHLELTGNLDEALKYAQAEYERRPKNIDVNKMMAFIYYAKKDFSKASVHAKEASRTQSAHPDLRRLRGLLAQQ